ncbi:MAG: acetolactate synthase [Gemmataceae bacterium]|nr:acetolactate synthase [Gemmataceae bacterium]
MSFGEDEGAALDELTARGREWPSVRQFNVFLANRMGALLDLVRRFETTDVKLVALTVVENTDCAIIRVVPDNPERAYEILTAAKLPFTESDLLVVKLPDNDQPLVTICKAMLGAEIDIHYAYPLMIGVGPMGNTAVALHVEDHETAATTLSNLGFTIYTENDLSDG